VRQTTSAEELTLSLQAVSFAMHTKLGNLRLASLAEASVLLYSQLAHMQQLQPKVEEGCPGFYMPQMRVIQTSHRQLMSKQHSSSWSPSYYEAVIVTFWGHIQFFKWTSGTGAIMFWRIALCWAHSNSLCMWPALLGCLLRALYSHLPEGMYATSQQFLGPNGGVLMELQAKCVLTQRHNSCLVDYRWNVESEAEESFLDGSDGCQPQGNTLVTDTIAKISSWFHFWNKKWVTTSQCCVVVIGTRMSQWFHITAWPLACIIAYPSGRVAEPNVEASINAQLC